MLQVADEIICPGQSGRGNAFLIRGIQLAEPDVVHDRAGEQVCVLQHNAQGVTQIVFFDQLDVNAVIGDHAALDVVESVDQVRDRGLAGTGGTDESDFLSRFGKQRNIMQDLLFLGVAEVHIIEPDIAFEFHQFGFAIGTGMLPAPVTGIFLCFHPLSVLLLCTDQRDHTVVGFRRCVHESENPLGTGTGHDHGIDLLRDLHDGVVEGTVQLQEGRNGTQCYSEHAVQGEDGACQSGQDIGNVADVHADGHEDVGKFIGIGTGITQFVIDCFEILDGLLFVCEDLDHPLALHHFLDESVHCTQLFLLFPEKPAGAGGDEAAGIEHDTAHDHRHQRQLPVHDKHRHQHKHNLCAAGEHLGSRLGNQLPQGISVIGVNRHDVTVGVGIEVGNRQCFHMPEQPFTDIVESTQGNVDHQPVPDPGGQNTRQVNPCHSGNGLEQSAEIRVALA